MEFRLLFTKFFIDEGLRSKTCEEKLSKIEENIIIISNSKKNCFLYNSAT